MSKPFDPYHVWLGIPAKDQPPNHYRLLGIELFEDNADVIDAAAMRQTSYLRGMSSGEHRRESQQILNEVSAARRCLLDAARKEAYDEELRNEQSAAATEASVPSPPSSPIAGAPPQIAPPPQVSPFPSFRKSEPTPPAANPPETLAFPEVESSPSMPEQGMFFPVAEDGPRIQSPTVSSSARLRKPQANIPAYKNPVFHMMIGGVALVVAIIIFSIRGCDSRPGDRVYKEEELLNEDGGFFNTPAKPPATEPGTTESTKPEPSKPATNKKKK
ncbi:MAG: hypothetical protein R3C01_11655 [Planctomycetaceae bacterium]